MKTGTLKTIVWSFQTTYSCSVWEKFIIWNFRWLWYCEFI